MESDAHLTRRERQIMDVLHARGHATAAEVLREIPNGPGYSAVRTLLRILENKGHVRHRRQGLRYVYVPTQPRSRASRSALRRVLRTFFGGSAPQAVAALLEASDTELTSSDLDQLQAIIDQARKEGR